MTLYSVTRSQRTDEHQASWVFRSL